MEGSLLVLDGSSRAAYSVGCHREGTYMGEFLGRTVELVDSIHEARGALEESDNLPFSAVITEPFMFYGRADALKQYQAFLNNLRMLKGLPVVVWSSQEKKVAEREYGLREGVHYDAYSPKMSRTLSSAEALRDTIEYLLSLQIRA